MNRLLSSALALLLAALCCGAWMADPPPRIGEAPRLVALCGRASAVYPWTWSQGVVLADPAVHVGALPRSHHRLFCLAPVSPPLRAGDRVWVGGTYAIEPWRDGPRHRIRAAALRVRARRERSARGVLWQALDRLHRHRDLAARLLLGCGRVSDREVFRRGGLMHLLAVSGLHLGLVLALAAAALRVAVRPWAARQVLLVLLAGIYLWIAGDSLATRRAAVMVAAVVVARLAGRRPHRLAALSLALIVLLAWSPGQARELGLQLSAAAVLGIVTLGRELVALRRRLLPLQPLPLSAALWRGTLWLLRQGCDGLLIGLAAGLAVAPLTAGVFGTISPWAPVATVLAAPFLVLTLAGGALLLPLSAVWPEGPWAGCYLLVECGLDALVGVARMVAQWPAAHWRCGAFPWCLMLLWPLWFVLLPRWLRRIPRITRQRSADHSSRVESSSTALQ
ncbi:MAG: ComEC/Rec2 family competence protein [Planctomycetota bacterium]